MKIKGLFIVVVSFVIFLFIFLPYAKIYNYLIYKVLKHNHISATYEIEKASLLSVELKNLNFTIGSRKYRIKKITVYINPLFLVSSKLGKIAIDGNKARFKVLKGTNSFKSFVIEGYFLTGLLKQFLDEPYTEMLSGFRGKNNLTAKVKLVKSGIVLEDLTISGKFIVKAKGYISNQGLNLRGYVKIGKVKHGFSI